MRWREVSSPVSSSPSMEARRPVTRVRSRSGNAASPARGAMSAEASRRLTERNSEAPRSSGTPLEVVGRAPAGEVTYSSPCRTRSSRRSALHSSGVGEGGMPSPARLAVVFGGVRSGAVGAPPASLRAENRAPGVSTSSASRRGSVRPSARSPVPSPAPSRDGARAERGIALDRAGTTERPRRDSCRIRQQRRPIDVLRVVEKVFFFSRNETAQSGAPPRRRMRVVSWRR